MQFGKGVEEAIGGKTGAMQEASVKTWYLRAGGEGWEQGVRGERDLHQKHQKIKTNN